MQLILGSSSESRALVLKKLNLPFVQVRPDIDETPKTGESAQDLVLRLAIEKAQAVAQSLGPLTGPTYVIGSDQVADVDGEMVSKPLDHNDAIRQLKSVRNRAITFYTGLCLLNANTGQYRTAIDPFVVKFRNYSDHDIERYLKLEQPYACAGSLRCEGLGITLIAAMEGKDPNTLIGLPLIDLITLLKEEWIDLLDR